MPLAGQTVVLTGPDGRLGPIWRAALESAGATVIGVGLPAHDFRTPEGIQAVCQRPWADVDVLVQNAGVDSRPDGTGGDEAMLAVNVLAVKRIGEAYALARSAAHQPGVIVNIASLYGLVAPDGRYYRHRLDGWCKDAMYGATKAAIIQLTRDQAARFGPLGVRANALAPGGVVDPADPLTVGDVHFREKYEARIPLGRMCRPADLAGPLVFLASAASSFVTGVTIPLDGGYLCW